MSASRRDFLKMGIAAGAVLGAASLLPSKAQAAWTKVSLDECIAMSPEYMAESSGEVSAAWREMVQSAESIRNTGIRRAVVDILNNPAPTIADDIDQPAAIAMLKKEGMLAADASDTVLLPPCSSTNKTPQPFWSAPGSGWGSHHAYPGGLVTHTNFNVRSTLSFLDNYRHVYGFQMDTDVALAGQLLHDLHKPWVFQWQKDGKCRTESTLVGQGEHHVLSIAESIKRKLPAEVVVAQALAHNHAASPADEAGAVSWIKAACLLLGKDPVALGLLAEDGKTLPLPRRMEGFMVHLGDHDWVISVPAAKWLMPALTQVAEQDFGLKGADLTGKPFNAFRNYVLAQATIMRLYQVYSTQGSEGLACVAKSIVRK